MKSLFVPFAGLMFVLSAGLVQAADATSEHSSEKATEEQPYISWTWEDIED